MATTVNDSKAKVDKVCLEMHMKIVELQMQLQPSTPPKVCGQHATKLKAASKQVESHIQECLHIVGEVLDVLASLQEDPHVKKLQAEALMKLETNGLD